MALDTKPYKGARDFYPADKQLQNYIFGIWREVAASYGYQEYDAPIIEPLDIYAAKTSQEIVNEQTYSFEDRGGRKVTLRPEMTPTVSRMVAAKRQELALPLRWYSIPNLWRYERPQRGRLREHWQLNVDLFGIAGIEADHEIIAIADAIMQRFGAKRDMYVIRLNSRQLTNYILQDFIGLNSEQSAATIRLIDRIHKIPADELKAALNDIAADKTDQLLNIFKAHSYDALPEDIKNHKIAQHLHKLEMMLARGGITNTKFDVTLMRGFDYYTDIVFEVFDTNPENSRAIFGGGRYDGLVGAFGVEPLPTIGFGLGDVTLHDFLQTHNLLPTIKQPVDLCVITIGDVYLEAQKLLTDLRSDGLKVVVDSTGRKIDKQLKSADKAGFEWILFVGEQELASGDYKLKHLPSGKEQSLGLGEIAKTIKTS